MGFASGALSSVASSLWSGGNSYNADGEVIGGMKGLGGKQAGSTAGMLTFGSVMGGAGAALTGGNFWQGAATGLIVSGLNHAMHKQNSDPPKKNYKAYFKALARRFSAMQKLGTVGYAMLLAQ